MPKLHSSPPPSQRPYLLANMAMSADGKTAAPRSLFSHFGSKADQSNLYKLRATVDGILCGAATIAKDNASLLPAKHNRRENPQAKPFYRIAVTGTGSLPLTSTLFKTTTPPILILTTNSAPRKTRERYQAIAAGIHITKGKQIHWRQALAWLHEKWRIRRLLLEGGGTLNQSLFRLDLVDEINLTICPFIVGGNQAPTIADGKAFPTLNDSTQWQWTKRRQHNGDLYLTLIRKRNLPPKNSQQ